MAESTPAPDSGERAAALERFEKALGYRFSRRELLEDALRHSSYAHELGARARGRKEGAPGDRVEDNERLEFLGDAVIAVVVAHALYRSKPEWREGELTRALHALVEGRSLERLARSLELGAVLRLGSTERKSGGHEKPSILADAMEAVVGAIFLDGGLDAVAEFVERVFADSLARDAAPVRRDPKTEFQERVMAVEGAFPNYRLIGDSGIEGDAARFTVEVRIRDRPVAEGVGRTKRAAEREAATRALEARAWEANEGGQGA